MAVLQNTTPEPWHVEFDEVGGYEGMSSAFYVMAGEDLVATLDIEDYVPRGGDKHGRPPTAEANAMLIALAPILARLLEEAGIPIPTSAIAPQV